MSVHDLSSFCCSLCGKPIPDKDLKELATIRLSKNRTLEVVCGDCISEGAPEKKRGSLIIMSEFKLRSIT